MSGCFVGEMRLHELLFVLCYWLLRAVEVLPHIHILLGQPLGEKQQMGLYTHSQET